MRRLFSLLLAVSLLTLLCACSGNISPDALAKSVTEEYNKAESLSMVMDLTADYGDKVFQYGLKFEGTADSGTLTVTAPENIAGISARLSGGGIALEYDGVSLETGKLSPDGLSPLDAVPAMLSAWKSGYPEECVIESADGENFVSVGYPLTETEYLRTWFDTETLLPYSAEISSDGRVVIKCAFDNVII